MSWNQNDTLNMLKVEDRHGLKIDNMNGITTVCQSDIHTELNNQKTKK